MNNNNAAKSGYSSASKPLPPERFKNNLLKAKTDEIDSYMKYRYEILPLFPQKIATHVSIFSGEDTSGKNPNLTNGESPPPKEVPDMSSATFVSVVRNFD